MRILLLVLLSALTIVAQNPQATPPAGRLPNNLSIPAQLDATVDTKKCKAGDVIEMRTLEPVLVGGGQVMPEHTKLSGRVLGAASRQNDKPSWLLLVIDRAEWNGHSLPLRAFIISQITVKASVQAENDSAFQGAIDMPDALFNRRSHAQLTTQGDPGSSGLSVSAAHPLKDGTIEKGQAQQLSYQRLDDVHLLPASNGSIYLLSAKDHLKLPSGTMFMLRNRPLPASRQ
ncbi:MAG: hypothetical protein WAM71_19065 [Candidatus Korobacteraceae bacterium]